MLITTLNMSSSQSLKKELVPLFKDDMDKVFIHHDKASSHTAGKTVEFLTQMNEKYGITFQRKEDIVVKGADVAPMDFFGFGWLKSKVKKRRFRTFKGFVKTIREEWSKLSPQFCENVFEEWKARCLLIKKEQGRHIEQIKKIHNKRR